MDFSVLTEKLFGVIRLPDFKQHLQEHTWEINYLWIIKIMFSV